MRREARTFEQITEDPPTGPIPIDPPAQHTTDSDSCWCQPRIIETLPDGRIIVHKRTMDGPDA